MFNCSFKLTKFLKWTGVAALLVGAQLAYAETGFKVPIHYKIELIDGLDNFDNYSMWSRIAELTPGRHQIVVKFSGRFGSASDDDVISSGSPLVIDIYDLKQDQLISFDYPIPDSPRRARDYARNQQIILTDTKGRNLTSSEAEYFLMTSEVGFTMLRDYRNELMSLGRLYAPNYVAGENRTIGMTAYGTPTIEATNSLSPSMQAANSTMAAPNTNYLQESTLATSSTRDGAVTYSQLVKLYNEADDSTKLRFFKYIMSNNN